MSLADLIAPAPRLAVVGLAKNTGKTETMNAILRELNTQGWIVGATSIGRDGETRDVIDNRIDKPRVRLAAGSLVATTDALLRASAVPHETVWQTSIRTPLGRVSVARLQAEGAIEIAGPSVAQDVRVVADAMLEGGAQQVVVDGAIDRRAASSPAVCDGLVICTGAVLHQEIEQVVSCTREAIELFQLPLVEDERIHSLAAASRDSLLISAADGFGALTLPLRFALESDTSAIARVLASNPSGDHLLVRGALHEAFLHGLLDATRGRPMEVVAEDSTKLFFGKRDCSWFRRRGLSLSVLASTRLCAVTVNPIAPRSHSFESGRLQQLVQAVAGEVPVLDVRSPDA